MRSVLPVALAVLLVACAEAGIGSVPDGGGPCITDSDCPLGQTCQAGLCGFGTTQDGGFSFDASVVPSDGGLVDGGADAGVPDAGLLLGFGEPCIDNASCQSGICIQSSLGPVCSKFCSDDCPIDWGC